MKRFLAFTLAETLIVIGIIGVVSALTLPNLNSSTGDKEKVAKVKKIYQNLNDALGRAQVVYGPFDEWTINDSTYAAQGKRVGDRLTEFMKLSKNCGQVKGSGCMDAQYKTKTGSNFMDFANDENYKVILADGTALILLPEGHFFCRYRWTNERSTNTRC